MKRDFYAFGDIMSFPDCDYIYEASANYKEILKKCKIGTRLIRESSNEKGALCESQRVASRDVEVFIVSTRLYLNGDSWSRAKGEKFQPVSKYTITQKQYDLLLVYLEIEDQDIPFNHNVLKKAKEEKDAIEVALESPYPFPQKALKNTEKTLQELSKLIKRMENKIIPVKENLQPPSQFENLVHSPNTLISNFNNNSPPPLPSLVQDENSNRWVPY